MKKPTKEQIFSYLDNLATPSTKDITETFAISQKEAFDIMRQWIERRRTVTNNG